jgi:transcriptional regulator with XRE-family HTH domain
MNTPNKNTWHDRLKATRLAARLSRREVAEMCAVAPATVQDWEDGRIKRLTAGNAMTVSERLGINLDWLIHGTGPATRPPSTSGIVDDQKKDIELILSIVSEIKQRQIFEAIRMLVAVSDENFDLTLGMMKTAFLQPILTSSVHKDELTKLIQAYISAKPKSRAEALDILKNN